VPGQYTLRRTDDRGAETVLHARQFIFAGINTQARSRDSLQFANRMLSIAAVLQIDRQDRCRFAFFNPVIPDVSLLLEDFRNVYQQF
jgi:hypothetical protein